MYSLIFDLTKVLYMGIGVGEGALYFESGSHVSAGPLINPLSPKGMCQDGLELHNTPALVDILGRLN